MVKKNFAQPLQGVMLVDKPEGLTSAAVVGKLKRFFRQKKVGHAGTLDPMATGLLPLFFNEATKYAGHFSDADKTYRVGLQLGLETDTYDISGEIVTQAERVVSEGEIRKALQSFQGSFTQLAPAFSAKKENGRPQYEKARAGEAVTRKACEVSLKSLTIHEIRFPMVEFTIEVSKGFYVRSLCHDVGRKLKTGGVMRTLRRLKHGAFDIADAVEFETIFNRYKETPKAILLPLDSDKIDIPKVLVSDEIAARLKAGLPIDLALAKEGMTPFPLNAESVSRAITKAGEVVALIEPNRADEKRQAIRIVRGMNP